jgi:hypothetical protein
MGSINWWAPRWLQRVVARLGLYEGPDWTDVPRPAAREGALGEPPVEAGDAVPGEPVTAG